jgi:tetratricopeptide (TPR) repeat protein
MNEYYEKGLECCQREAYEEAIGLFNKSLLMSPMHLEAFYNRGLAKLFLKRYLDAIQDFNEALSINQQIADIYSQRGVAYHLMGKQQEALTDMDKALALEPENPYRYSSRAYIRGKMGDVFGAVDDYKKAVALDPEDAIAWNNLGILEMSMGFKQSANEHFKKADEIADDGVTFERPSLDDLLKEANAGENGMPPIVRSPQKEENLPPMPPIGKNSIPTQPKNTGLTFSTYWSVLKEVLSSKKGFTSFISFIRAGLKKSS